MKNFAYLSHFIVFIFIAFFSPKNRLLRVVAKIETGMQKIKKTLVTVKILRNTCIKLFFML